MNNSKPVASPVTLSGEIGAMDKDFPPLDITHEDREGNEYLHPSREHLDELACRERQLVTALANETAESAWKRGYELGCEAEASNFDSKGVYPMPYLTPQQVYELDWRTPAIKESQKPVAVTLSEGQETQEKKS